MEDGRKNNKGHPGSGRKSKAEEQKLIEHLTPMNPLALKALKEGLTKKAPWAIKLYFEYFYGKPHQSMGLTLDTPIPIIDMTQWK